MTKETDLRIKVVINNNETFLERQMTIIEMLEAKNCSRRTAVWVNGKQLLRAEYPTRVIRDGDIIKILRIVAGG